MTSTASSSLSLEEIYTPPPISAPSSPVPSDDEDCPPPGKHLPYELRLDRRRLKRDAKYQKPEKLFYGFGANIRDVLEYHRTHGLPLPNCQTTDLMWLFIMEDVVKHLCKVCRHDFQFVMPRGDYDMEIALYDSYTIHRENLARDEEEDVIRLLRRELDVCKDQEPRWYYSSIDED
ncbi:hypothetical protein GGU11DRAFT_756871 [Lentinula aff. detonsa]|uniref:Uncharacterized protein n=2 Tax=Lentinula TaxID=5352 RepID=A0AA38KUY1_9AGAR|nr:hypothetical protein GGU10DRAFT_335139 [Lentinula aff. detonsa]KAJ3797252.1 hypothetical protein GGU11DRAFT_756871 [Lentinula aff. detonsa]